MQNREQKLIDIMYQIGFTIHTNKWFKNKTQDEIAEWISGQLRDCGFKVSPCGSSYGTLDRE
jgi:hypothetical protein